MSFIITVFAGSILGLSYVANKKLAIGNFKSTTLTTAYSTLGALFALPLLLYQFRLPTDTYHWSLAIVSPITFGLGSICGFRAYKTTEASVVGLIGRLSIVFTSIFGITFLMEKYNTFNYLGLIAVFLGSMLIVYKKGRLEINEGVFYSILMALGFGVAGAIDKIVIEEFSPFSYVFFNNLIIVIIFWLVFRPQKEIFKLFKTKTIWVLASALFGLGGWVSFLYALQTGNVSSLYPIWESVALIVTVIVSIKLFNEKSKNFQKILGVIITVLGIVLLG